MKTVFVIFDGMTALDFVGVYDPLTRLASMKIMPQFTWNICARTDSVVDDRGLQFAADTVGGLLSGYDLVVVPGGIGTRALMRDDSFMAWLKSAEPVPLKASVCTGALLLGAAGFLHGRRAATHPTAMQELRPSCGQVVSERVVDEGDVVTAGGVTAGIDLGLHLVERIAGKDVRCRIADQMDYPARRML
jgi:transcriptional regulator GlxA family with amidase domain